VVGAIRVVIHDATWRGCAGSMTGAAELSLGDVATWPSATAVQLGRVWENAIMCAELRP
jgi:hypothetical protein